MIVSAVNPLSRSLPFQRRKDLAMLINVLGLALARVYGLLQKML
jgi:hypothetical protein